MKNSNDRNQATAGPGESPEPTIDVLERVVKGVPFRTESSIDTFWKLVIPEIRRTDDPIDCTFMKSLTGRKECEIRDFDKQMDHWIERQPKEWRERYQGMKESMIKVFSPRFVFRMSDPDPDNYNIAYFIMGIDYQNNLLGVMADGVES